MHLIFLFVSISFREVRDIGAMQKVINRMKLSSHDSNVVIIKEVATEIGISKC